MRVSVDGEMSVIESTFVTPVIYVKAFVNNESLYQNVNKHKRTSLLAVCNCYSYRVFMNIF